MKIVGKEIIQTTRYLNFIGIHFHNKIGERDIWYAAERPNGGRTVLVAALYDNKLVVTKEFRVPVEDYEWALPAGFVDKDETPEETAKRELKEETNLDLVSVSFCTPFLYNTAGMTNEVVSIVYGHAQGFISQKGNEHTEDITCFLFTKQQMKDLLSDPEKKISAKAYLIYERFIRGDLW
jgi:ADP-ribose pyrophosphatase